MSWRAKPTEAATVFETDSTSTTALTVQGYMPATTVGTAWVNDLFVSKSTLARTTFSSTAGLLRMFSHNDFASDEAGYGRYSLGTRVSAMQFGDVWKLLVGDRSPAPSSVEDAVGLDSDPTDRKFPYIVYFDSNDYSGGAYGGDPYSFEFIVDGMWIDYPATATPSVWPTHIPKLKFVSTDSPWSYSTTGMAVDPFASASLQVAAGVAGGGSTAGTDPTASFGVVYSQPSIVHMVDQRGQHKGWLLLLNRARSWSFTSGFTSGSPPDNTSGTSLWDVVGYYDPNPEPTFSTQDTIGPFLLVSGESRCAVGVDVDLLTWVGTCGGVVMFVDGELWLYLYYDVSTPTTLTVGGVDVHTYTPDQYNLLTSKIDTSASEALDDTWLFGKYLASSDGQVCARRIRMTDMEALFTAFWWRTENKTGESSWTADSVVTGEALGPVRFWMADTSTGGSVGVQLLVDFRGWLNFAENAAGKNAFDVGRFMRVRTADPEPRLHAGDTKAVDPTLTPLTLFCSVKPVGSPEAGDEQSTDAASTLPLGRGFWQFWAIDGGETYVAVEFGATSETVGLSERTTVFGVDFVVSNFEVDPDHAYRINPTSGKKVRPRDLVARSGLTATSTSGTTTTTFSTVVDWADSAPQLIPALAVSGDPASYLVFGAGLKRLNADSDVEDPMGVEARIAGSFSEGRTWRDCWTEEGRSSGIFSLRPWGMEWTEDRWSTPPPAHLRPQRVVRAAQELLNHQPMSQVHGGDPLNPSRFAPSAACRPRRPNYSVSETKRPHPKRPGANGPGTTGEAPLFGLDAIHEALDLNPAPPRPSFELGALHDPTPPVLPPAEPELSPPGHGGAPDEDR